MRLHRGPQRKKIENHREFEESFLCGSQFLLCGSLCNLIPENKTYNFAYLYSLNSQLIYRYARNFNIDIFG